MLLCDEVESAGDGALPVGVGAFGRGGGRMEVFFAGGPFAGRGRPAMAIEVIEG
jgi:hypothetical protein